MRLNRWHWFWLPSRRPSYRIKETRSAWFPYKLQQRWRWFLFECWVTRDESSYFSFMEAEMQRLQRLDEDADPDHILVRQ